MNTIMKNCGFREDIELGKAEYVIGADKMIICRPEAAKRFARRFGLKFISPIEFSRRYILCQ